MVRIKEGFKGQRLLSLPDDILRKYSQLPLVRPLYIRKMGFFPLVQHHYVQKDVGTDYCMLIYCVGGCGWYALQDHEPRKVEANHYLLLPPDTPYRFWADEHQPWTIYWIHFQGALAKDFLLYPVLSRPILPGNISRLQDRLNLFENIYDSFSMAYTREYMTHASLCLYALLSTFLHVDAFRHYRLPQHANDSFAVKVVHYMQENIANNLTLEELAGKFQYSTSHFSALFKKETGYSPINYYIQLKVRKACEYMELTHLKLYEIAEKVGFEEPSYFTRLFTKIMGMSPTEYRRRETSFGRENR